MPGKVKKLSIGEETFDLHCKAYGLHPEREFRFMENRKFRFDFAWPSRKIALEVDGATAYGEGRHSRGQGYEADAVKMNWAARNGWMVFRFTTAMVERGEAIDWMREVLNG